MRFNPLSATVMKFVNESSIRFDFQIAFTDGHTIPAKDFFGKTLTSYSKQGNSFCHIETTITARKGLCSVFPNLKVFFIIVFIFLFNMLSLYYLKLFWLIAFWDILFFPRPLFSFCTLVLFYANFL